MVASSQIAALFVFGLLATVVAAGQEDDQQHDFSQAKRWGTEGHVTVAQVAYTRLTPTARAAVDRLLAGRTVQQVAMIPDSYRTYGQWSAPLHYVNLPRSATRYLPQYCPSPPGCVVSAVANYTQLVQRGGRNAPVCSFATPRTEPCPLVFLIHFVGDLHQPIHVGYADDKGGNNQKVTFFGQSTNLHSLWDTGLIRRYQQVVVDLVADIQQMIRDNPRLVNEFISQMDFNSWAEESYSIVRTNCYDFGSTGPDNLGAWYYDRNMPLVRLRIMAAAVRLAQLLNTIFG